MYGTVQGRAVKETAAVYMAGRGAGEQLAGCKGRAADLACIAMDLLFLWKLVHSQKNWWRQVRRVGLRRASGRGGCEGCGRWRQVTASSIAATRGRAVHKRTNAENIGWLSLLLGSGLWSFLCCGTCCDIAMHMHHIPKP